METIVREAVAIHAQAIAVEYLLGQYDDPQLARERLRLHTDHDWVDIGAGVSDDQCGCRITLARLVQ